MKTAAEPRPVPRWCIVWRYTRSPLLRRAGKKKVWDLALTVERTADEQPELVGTVFTVCPRQRPGGMAKIGRSSGEDFKGGKGVSLPRDWGVSTWHGKVRR